MLPINCGTFGGSTPQFVGQVCRRSRSRSSWRQPTWLSFMASKLMCVCVRVCFILFSCFLMSSSSGAEFQLCSPSVTLANCSMSRSPGLSLSPCLSLYLALPRLFPQLHSYFAGVRLNYTSADRNSSEKNIFDLGSTEAALPVPKPISSRSLRHENLMPA